jgi:cbb3-type cytochrome oxidase cytochrome c subunit
MEDFEPLVRRNPVAGCSDMLKSDCIKSPTCAWKKNTGCVSKPRNRVIEGLKEEYKLYLAEKAKYHEQVSHQALLKKSNMPNFNVSIEAAKVDTYAQTKLPEEDDEEDEYIIKPIEEDDKEDKEDKEDDKEKINNSNPHVSQLRRLSIP